MAFFRNVASMLVANGLAKPLWFLFITAACMRFLGAEGYGLLNVLLSLSAMTTSFSDFGLSEYTVHQTARDRSRASRLFSNAIVLRLLGSSLAFIVTVITGLVLGYSAGILAGLALAGLYHIVVGLIQFLRNYFRAIENLTLESLSLTAEKFIVVIVAFLVLVATGSPTWTIAGLVAGGLIMLIASFVHVQRRYLLFKRDHWEKRYGGKIARASVPFAFASLFSILYLRSDIVIIGLMLSDLSAGQYAAGYRILEGVNILPVIVAQAAFLPMISRLVKAGERTEAFRRLLLLCLAVVVIGGSIAGTLFYFSGPIITLLDPNPAFAPAADALAILALSFPLIFLQNLFFVALIALGAQAYRAILLGIGLAINVGLTLYLVTRMGIIGAAYATIVAELFFTIGYGIKVLQLRRKKLRFK